MVFVGQPQHEVTCYRLMGNRLCGDWSAINDRQRNRSRLFLQGDIVGFHKSLADEVGRSATIQHNLDRLTPMSLWLESATKGEVS